MQLYSRIVEVEQELCNITIPDEYEENASLSHYSIQFRDENVVDINVKAIHASGLYIQETFIKSFLQVSEQFFAKGKHVRFMFYLKGNSSMQNGAGNQNYKHDIGMLQRNFLDSNGGDGLVRLKKNDETSYIIIKMSREFYINILKNESWICEDSFHNYILKGIPENRPNETLYMDAKIIHILQDILNSGDIANRYHYLKLKLREILFNIHQITHFGLSKQDKELPLSSVNILDKIRGFLILNLDNPPSLSQLSKKFLLFSFALE